MAGFGRLHIDESMMIVQLLFWLDKGGGKKMDLQQLKEHQVHLPMSGFVLSTSGGVTV